MGCDLRAAEHIHGSPAALGGRAWREWRRMICLHCLAGHRPSVPGIHSDGENTSVLVINGKVALESKRGLGGDLHER